MEFRILGAVEIWSGGVVVAIGGQQPRLILAALLVEANRPVPVDRLIDLVWGQAPPPSARAAVQAMVSRLRAVLRKVGMPAQIAGERGGYILRLDPMLVDVHRFSSLVQQAGSAPDDETSVELFDRALELWRGEPLMDIAGDDVRHRLCAGLQETRWTAVEDRAEALLRLGRTRSIVRELPDQVAGQPYRQRLAGQLMRALYQEGRPDRALEIYQELRSRLADELGLDPAPELSRLHQLVLQGHSTLEPPDTGPRHRPVRPAELPHDMPGFIGRDGELTQLDRITCEPTATRVWVLSGTPGVGKTTLAVRWAHQVREAFPDGQLFIDLRGFDTERDPVAPSAALAQLLAGLGADPRTMPDELDARAALFRSRMAGQRILLVLDNARDAHQVLPLLPSSGTVLVTSRHRLGELVVRVGARPLPLNVLTPADSVRLLAAVVGDDAVRAESAATARLAELCGHLPLALRIAASNLQASGEPEIAKLTRELASGDPLTGLTIDGADEGAVTKAFALSYRALPMAQRKLFRRLGLVPGGSFTADVASALDPMAPNSAARMLRALASAHLLERQAGDRYRFHDLLRRFAVDRLIAEENDVARHDARTRLLDHYLSNADAAGRRLIPHILRLPRPVPADPFSDAETALAWLDAEAANLTAAIHHAAANGPLTYAWQLTDALRAWFHQRGRRTEWLAAATAALHAAEAEGDPMAQAVMHLSIALAYVNAGRYEDARRHLLHGLRINSADDWPEGHTGLLNHLSTVHQRLGNPRAAIACARSSLNLNRRHGNDGAEPMSLANLGFAYWQLGTLSEADKHLQAALTRAERTGSRYKVAVLLVDLAGVRRDLGDRDAAEELYARALDANRDLGYRDGEASALSGRALFWSLTGRASTALPDAERAVALTLEIGDLGTEAWMRYALGQVLLAAGRTAGATAEHQRALDLARQTSFTWCEASALSGMAAARLAAGERHTAREHAEVALAMAVQAGYRLIEIGAVRVLAQVAHAVGDQARASRLHERADRLADQTGYRARHIQGLDVAMLSEPFRASRR